MCETRQHDGFINGEQDDAVTQVPLPDSAKEQNACGEENWRKLAKLAQAETDPDKLMDLAQQLMNALDRDDSTKRPPTVKSSTGVDGTQE